MATPEDLIMPTDDIIDMDYSYGDDTPDIPSRLITLSQKTNLVEEFEDDLAKIEHQITAQYSEDEGSMGEWLSKYDKALTLARMHCDEDRDFPFQGASKVMAPFVIEAAMEFNSRITIDVLASSDPASFQMFGKETEEKQDRAERASEYFNTKLQKSTWADESDVEAMALPIVGTTYKKVYWDEMAQECVSKYCSADKIIFSQDFSFEKAPQVAEKVMYTRNQLVGGKNAGIFEFEDSKLGDREEFDGYEVHFNYDQDGDDYAEPYIALYLFDLGIIRIRAGFLPEDVRSNGGKVTQITRKEYFSQKKLMPDPDGSPMGMGFGILLADSYETINTNLRQLVDAGTLSNVSANSGLIANVSSPMMGMDGRMEEGPIELEMGMLKKVNVSSGQTLAQNVVQLPFKGASPVLFQLLQYMDETARRMTTVSYNVEASPNEAASLYMAKLGQALKAYNAMMYRYFRGLTKEFKLMARCMYEYADDLQADYVNILDGDFSLEADFNPKDCDISPTANPAHGSDIERVAKAEIVVQSAQMNPQLNQRKAWEDYYKALGVQDIDQLMPEQEGPTPMEKQQAAFMAMEAEFRNREMQTKENRLALDEMKVMLDAKKAAAELEQQGILNAAEIDNMMADTLKKLTEASVENVNTYLAVLDRYESSLTTGNNNANLQRRDSAMAGASSNAALPPLPQGVGPMV